MGVLVDESDIIEKEIEGETFKLKPLNFGESNEITKECTSFDAMSGRFDMETGKLGELRLVKMIADWTLTDDKGKKLPITLENVRRLKDNVAAELLTETRRLSVVAKDLEKE